MSRLIQVIVIVSAGGTMGVTYKKLFKLLIDRNMKKKDLRDLAGIGNSTMTKLSNDENVTIEVMAKIISNMELSHLHTHFFSSNQVRNFYESLTSDHK